MSDLTKTTVTWNFSRDNLNVALSAYKMTKQYPVIRIEQEYLYTKGHVEHLELSLSDTELLIKELQDRVTLFKNNINTI